MWCWLALALALLLAAVRHCATQRKGSAYRWWCGFRNYHLPPLLDLAHAPYFSTQRLARTLASFCSFRSSCSPHLSTRPSSEPGPGLDRGVYRRQGPVNRRRPPQFQPSGRCSFACLVPVLFSCLLGAAPLLHRPVCGGSSRHPSIARPLPIPTSPLDDSVRRNRVSSVLLSYIRLPDPFASSSYSIPVLQLVSSFSHRKGLQPCRLFVSGRRDTNALLHFLSPALHRRQLDQDRRSPECSRPG